MAEVAANEPQRGAFVPLQHPVTVDVIDTLIPTLPEEKRACYLSQPSYSVDLIREDELATNWQCPITKDFPQSKSVARIWPVLCVGNLKGIVVSEAMRRLRIAYARRPSNERDPINPLTNEEVSLSDWLNDRTLTDEEWNQCEAQRMGHEERSAAREQSAMCQSVKSMLDCVHRQKWNAAPTRNFIGMHMNMEEIIASANANTEERKRWAAEVAARQEESEARHNEMVAREHQEDLDRMDANRLVNQDQAEELDSAEMHNRSVMLLDDEDDDGPNFEDIFAAADARRTARRATLHGNPNDSSDDDEDEVVAMPVLAANNNERASNNNNNNHRNNNNRNREISQDEQALFDSRRGTRSFPRSFVGNDEGERCCFDLMTMIRNLPDTWAFIHNCREAAMIRLENRLFSSEGIFADFRHVTGRTISLKIGGAISRYNALIQNHSNDPTGVQGEERPIWFDIIQEYMEWKDQQTGNSQARRRRAVDTNVVRNLVGQQAPLGPGNQAQRSEIAAENPPAVQGPNILGDNIIVQPVNIVNNEQDAPPAPRRRSRRGSEANDNGNGNGRGSSNSILHARNVRTRTDDNPSGGSNASGGTMSDIVAQRRETMQGFSQAMVSMAEAMRQPPVPAAAHPTPVNSITDLATISSNLRDARQQLATAQAAGADTSVEQIVVDCWMSQLRTHHAAINGGNSRQPTD